MSGQARRFTAIAAFAACVSFAIFLSAGAANADTCLTAPGAAGPKGSRWYYRIEWPSQRKCWHLVQNDKRPAKTVKAAPQPEADDETEAAPAPVSPPPARIAQPDPGPAQPQPAPAWITRNVSSAADTSVPPAAAAVPSMDTAPPPVPRLESDARPVAAPPTSPPVAARDAATATSPDGAPTWRLLLAAVALLGFAGAAALVVLEVMRRRTDVLNTAMANVAPEDFGEPELAEDPPTFAPLPPMRLQEGDDIEEALRRFTQSWRRRAA
jgi:hypothetical protein